MISKNSLPFQLNYIVKLQKQKQAYQTVKFQKLKKLQNTFKNMDEFLITGYEKNYFKYTIMEYKIIVKGR